MSHSTPNAAAAAPPSEPAAAASVVLWLGKDAVAGNVEGLRRLDAHQLWWLAQAVGLAEKVREAVDSLAAIDDYLRDPYGAAPLTNSSR